MHILKFLLAVLIFPHVCLAGLDPYKALSEMSLEEKAAQVIVIGVMSEEEKNKEELLAFKARDLDYSQATAKKLIVEKKVGGVLFYGRKTLANELEEIISTLQSLSKKPLLCILDAETGLHNRLAEGEVVRFPQAMTLGALNNQTLVYQVGNHVGQQLKRLGIHLTTSPVADVNCHFANYVIGLRSFGGHPRGVAESATAFMKGLQNAGVLACGKHFPGHGDIAEGTTKKRARVPHDRKRLDVVELIPFKNLIDSGVRAIMTAHLEVPALEKQEGLPSFLSKAIVTDLLKNEMGFRGLIITDAPLIYETDTMSSIDASIRALEAGNHIILCPPKPEETIAAIVQAVRTGRLSEKKLDEIVLKILQAKAWALEQRKYDDKPLAEVLRSPKISAFQEMLYAKAVTLIKASSQPFGSPENKVVIACGDKKDGFINALNLSGIASHGLDKKVTDAEINALLPSLKKYEQIIITFHAMNPNFQEAYGITATYMTLIKKLKENGKQVTVVLFGTPYAASLVKNADTILVAYENEPAAQKAVVNILCGKLQAEGVLPVDVVL